MHHAGQHRQLSFGNRKGQAGQFGSPQVVQTQSCLHVCPSKHRLDNICLSKYYFIMTETSKLTSKQKKNSKKTTDLTVLPRVEFYTAEVYNAGESVGYLMRRIVALISQGVERELEPKGLTNAQWMPLLKLHMGHASTVAELARGCDLDAGSMTRLLDRLEAKDLVRRVRSVDDRRVVNLELTEAGQAAAKEIPAVLCGVQNAHLAGFSTEEWKTLKGFLRRILDTANTLQAEQSTAGKEPDNTSAASSQKTSHSS
jgi:DNA-binding MarR family transcriptional regulator